MRQAIWEGGLHAYHAVMLGFSECIFGGACGVAAADAVPSSCNIRIDFTNLQHDQSSMIRVI